LLEVTADEGLTALQPGTARGVLIWLELGANRRVPPMPMHVDMGRLGRYRIWGQFRVFDAG
jgi:hypothetical protein